MGPPPQAARPAESSPRVSTDLGVINIDDKYGRRLASSALVPITTFSAAGKDEADWRAVDVRSGADGSTFRVIGPGGVEADASLALVGPFNVANALGAVVAMTWLNYMPSVVLHGLEFNGIGAFETPAQIIAFPLMAACAIALAARDRRLGLATALVSIPTFFNVFGVIAFAIGVSLHGF